MSDSSSAAAARRLSQIVAPTGGSGGGGAEALGGWGSYSAASAAGSVAELDAATRGLHEVAQGLLPEEAAASNESPESWLRKALARLSRALSDEEVATRFKEQDGLTPLVSVLARHELLRPSGISFALQALKGFASHEFGAEALVQGLQSAGLQQQLWAILSRESAAAKNAASAPVGAPVMGPDGVVTSPSAASTGANAAVVRGVLSLLTELATRSPHGGFSLVLSMHLQHQSSFFPMLVAFALSPRNLGADVTLQGLKLVNALLRAARDQKQFDAVLSELAAPPQAGPDGKKPLSFASCIDTLQSSSPSGALKDELDGLAGLQKDGFKGVELPPAARKEIAALKAQLSDVSQLATEYRSTVSRLESELRNFKRREPLVQLLWAEIAQLRGALAVAIAGGFAYDLSDPQSRYVDAGHFAYIDRLDVSAFAPKQGGGGGGGGGGKVQGGSGRAGAAGKKKNNLQSISDDEDSDGGGGPRFIDENGDAIPEPPADDDAPPPPPPMPAGMRAGDAPEHLQQAAQNMGGFGMAGQDVRYSTAGPGQPGGAAASSRVSIVTAPGAPPAPGAPDAPPMAPGAPGAPMAPPMASGAPNAPPMAPGAPGPPGAPPMAPGAPSAPKTAAPTKPLIKPARKMRALHWSRIIVPVGNTDSLWSKVDTRLPDMAKKVPVQEIDALFADAKANAAGAVGAAVAGGAAGASKGAASANGAGSPTKASGGGDSASSGARSDVRVLSDKRFNAVAIMLSFLPPVDRVIRAVQRLDLSLLDKDQVAALHKQMPSEEELKALQSAGCRVEELARPEAFLATLSAAVPAVSSRIDCWAFSLTFAEVAADLRAPFGFIERAISSVRNSKALPQLCALVLHAGNYINGGTNRGQADGFDFAVLGRLAMIKDASGSGTLLSFVVHKLLDLEGAEFAARLSSDLAPCRAASEFPLRPALAASTRFQGVIKVQKNLAALVAATADDSTDAFPTVMGAFGRESEAVGQELKAIGQRVNEQFGLLLQYLNPAMDAQTAARTQSEELFETLAALAQQVQEISDAKKAQQEQQKQEAKQQEQREKQKAIRAKLAAEKAAQGQ